MISVRRVKETDIKDIFEWRNDEVTRKMSHTTQVVDWDAHCKWFSSSLANKNRLLLVCEDVYTLSKVAIVRFDTKNNTALISINVSPKARGKSLTKICLRASVSFFKTKFPLVSHIVAEIKSINIRSISVFESVGFSLKEKTNEIQSYEYVFKK